MSDIDLQLVKEFFELHRFRVTTHWHQHDLESSRNDGGMQVYVENTASPNTEESSVLLSLSDIPALCRAVIEVRPWHADRLYASVLESNPILTQFAEPWALGHARDYFGTDDFATVLILSKLPSNQEQRHSAIASLQKLPVDHAIEFHTILEGLSQKVLPSGTYPGSHTLQTIRLLKRYDLLHNRQMEFAFPMEPIRTAESTDPTVDVAELDDDKYADEEWDAN